MFHVYYLTVLFACPGLNSTHYLVKKINNKKWLQNIAINHSPDIDSKYFMNVYRECSKEQ